MVNRNDRTRLTQGLGTTFVGDSAYQKRIDRLQRDGAVRRVECPKCDALVGEDCRTPQGHRLPEHHVGDFWSGFWTRFHAGRIARAGV